MIPIDLVIDVLKTLRSRQILFIVDGGWGIDALVNGVTREHKDLDIAVDRAQLHDVVATLDDHGLEHDDDASPGLPARVVLNDASGREIDLHPLVFDDAGNGWQELAANAWGAYPAEGIDARGSIAGFAVRCLTAELQLRHHLGYPWDDTDIHDMRLLQHHFGLRLPPPFDARAMTASQIEIRQATAADLPFVEDMLYEAATWRGKGPDRDRVLSDERLARYISGWGRSGDTALLATDAHANRLGAAWFRMFTAQDPGYGFLHATVPELSTGVKNGYRGRGVGTRLVEAMIAEAREQGFSTLSLSVEKDNPAVRLYKRHGFRVVASDQGAFTMRLDLDES